MARQRSRQQRQDRHARRTLFDAQEQCYEWLEACLNVHQGIGSVDHEVARRGFHNAVLRYWVILRQYRTEGKARAMWNNPLTGDDEYTITAGGVSIESLEDLRKISFAVAENTNVELDPVEGQQKEQQSQSVFLDYQDALVVLMRLDDIVQALGLGVDIDQPFATDEPQRVPDHVQENAPAYDS